VRAIVGDHLGKPTSLPGVRSGPKPIPSERGWGQGGAVEEWTAVLGPHTGIGALGASKKACGFRERLTESSDVPHHVALYPPRLLL
jgi:hypothetical protein